jgi:asparagine synthase (glutamine-hydrolysing)
VCGIAGFTHLNGIAASGRIEAATNCLVHRGPDQQGVFESQSVSLGAVRLKIIDLTAGDQPMASDDGDTVIVFNGEIYNYREVREELQQLGHAFRTKCDTEVVLRSFLEWDTGCFSRLRGMFGVALWSEGKKRLILARDRMGIKPLYFCQKGPDIYFGSELKAILEHPEIERRIDIDGLNCFLRLNYVPAPHTLVEGIEKLRPGHVLEWKDGRTRTARYWELPVGTEEKWTLNSAKEKLDWLLRESVREHLISDVPLGVWASGGLDSSAILHYASQLTPHLMTFSVTFSGRSFDESVYIREAAAKYGTEHTEFDLDPGMDLTGAIEQFAYYSDEPSADAGALPVWYLSQMSRKHVTVALSGEGADELFGGYLTYLADRYAGRSRFVPSLLRKLGLAGVRRWPVSDDKISTEYKMKRFLQGSLLSKEDAHIFWNGTFSQSELKGLFVQADPKPMRELLAQVPAGKGLNRYLLFDQMYYLPDDILYKVDRMSMAHSLEVRPPFLDHRIVEFAASLPEELKVHGSNLKYVLRELMRDKLPKSILERSKMGFDIPAHDWFRGPLKSFLLDVLNRRAVEDSGLFRWAALEKLIRNHMERRINVGYHLWGLMTLFLWIKKWQIQTGPFAAESNSSRVHYGDPILTSR